MRTLLKAFLGLVLVVVIIVVTFGGFLVWSLVNAKVDTVGKVGFNRPLFVPPLAESHMDDEGRRVFDLVMQQGASDLGRDRPTPTWGFNGDYLGPTLRAERGEKVLVNVANELDEMSTVHWHGMHLPAVMDGGPHQPIEPGKTWSPTWRVDQPAATLWYHPHPHNETAEHAYRGLAGMFIVDDAKVSGLPDEYGVDDVPVIVQDKKYDGHELDDDPSLFDSTGILGDQVLVNGTPGPYFKVTTERVRLRLLNGSNARIYNFGFSDGRPFDQVATDGGLLPEPVRTHRLTLSPGERAEIVVTMKAAEEVTLRSEPLTELSSRFAGTEDRLDVLQLRAAKTLEASPDVSDHLAESPDLADDAVAKTRSFRLSGTNINGLDMDMSRVDATAELDSTERWVVENADGNPHNFHIHDVQFQVASVDGARPPAHLQGWKDTIFMPPRRKVELLVRFTDYADPDSAYMFHCHLLRHEDQGMMGQFVVVEPGQKADVEDHGEHEGH